MSGSENSTGCKIRGEFPRSLQFQFVVTRSVASQAGWFPLANIIVDLFPCTRRQSSRIMPYLFYSVANFIDPALTDCGDLVYTHKHQPKC
jgi:hypothetical protein